ncbi:hypothetical protein [Nocardia transvalensis]|uniref:hypothetical protein n=1 Tax=Nocardia transvalensis TaxID=37333 RepID=UPI001894971A|nr:hypothetical protein [Nocardia transvalensis]MBF6333671.1 hypothetical protein [Nocardia transvalensis]
MTTDIHRAELARARTVGALVRYARAQLGPDAPALMVQEWLANYGYAVPDAALDVSGDQDSFMDCTECSADRGMSPNGVILDGDDRQCGRVWRCIECKAEHTEIW